MGVPYVPVPKDHYIRLLMMTQQIETSMKVMSNQIWVLILWRFLERFVILMHSIEGIWHGQMLEAHGDPEPQIAVLARSYQRVSLSRGAMDGLESLLFIVELEVVADLRRFPTFNFECEFAREKKVAQIQHLYWNARREFVFFKFFIARRCIAAASPRR